MFANCRLLTVDCRLISDNYSIAIETEYFLRICIWSGILFHSTGYQVLHYQNRPGFYLRNGYVIISTRNSRHCRVNTLPIDSCVSLLNKVQEPKSCIIHHFHMCKFVYYMSRYQRWHIWLLCQQPIAGMCIVCPGIIYIPIQVKNLRFCFWQLQSCSWTWDLDLLCTTGDSVYWDG